ncbi:hypothetical protein BDR26DRAFT_903927, partial [Obelidium mucronatum]
MDAESGHKHALLTNLNLIFTNADGGDFSDIEVRAFGHVFRLHRVLLAANNYFRTLLKTGGLWRATNQSVLELSLADDGEQKITLGAFRIFLGRLYGVFDYATTITVENVFPLLATGRYFDDESLCMLCQKYIETNISASTVSLFMNYAHQKPHEAFSDGIIDAGLVFLCKHAAAMDTSDLMNIPECYLAGVLASDCLFVTDEQERLKLFDRVMGGWNTERRECSGVPSCSEEMDDDEDMSTSNTAEKEIIPSYSNDTLVDVDSNGLEQNSVMDKNLLKTAKKEFLIVGHVKDTDGSCALDKKLKWRIEANEEALCLGLDYLANERKE